MEEERDEFAETNPHVVMCNKSNSTFSALDRPPIKPGPAALHRRFTNSKCDGAR
jgi:hypothetical protein